MASIDRQFELEEGSTEPFEQQGAALHVGPEQRDATLTGGEPQDGDLVSSHCCGAGHEDLQYDSRAVADDGLGDEGFGCVAERLADGDVPVALEFRDDRRQLLEPRRRAGGNGFVAHDLGHADHCAVLAGPMPRA